jgi:hypothetical protein
MKIESTMVEMFRPKINGVFLLNIVLLCPESRICRIKKEKEALSELFYLAKRSFVKQMLIKNVEKLESCHK